MMAEDGWGSIDMRSRRFVAAVKACLVAADAAGSTLPRRIDAPEQRTAWIRTAFSAIPTPEQISQIIDLGLSGNELRTFQKAVAEEGGDVTFVKAGCGTGKTLAAYHWARNRCPGRRLYFCYPTTGTATEGYRDYLFDAERGAGRFGAELFHGRAQVDLDIILNVDRDVDAQAGAREHDEALSRIESLNAWSTPIVSCTVDTVLGLIQNHRRGLYSWPALAGAAFVFDEIHAYDYRLFAALLRFLESVGGVPVLLMTASLPNNRLEAIQKSIGKRGTTLSIPRRSEDLRALEERPRYRWAGETTTEHPLSAVVAELRCGGKTLWVCNTVDRAIDASVKAEAEGLSPIVYHSRFRYEDRVKRHAQVIDAFRTDRPALAICTQVAEMSLDLSATLLVTDIAPVSALVQRLGRLNRRARAGDPVKTFLVVEPVRENGKPFLAPYDEETYGDWSAASRRWLAQLPRDSITQADLATQWENLQGDESEPVADPSAWLAGGPTTTVRELRKGSPGLTVIMERDGKEVRAGRKRLVEVALPMPPPPEALKWKTWPRHNGVPLAPEGTIIYDERRGARWQKVRA
jgi:CRISPR-associated endonuclease/helicase Cas3